MYIQILGSFFEETGQGLLWAFLLHAGWNVNTMDGAGTTILFPANGSHESKVGGAGILMTENPRVQSSSRLLISRHESTKPANVENIVKTIPN